MRASEPSTRSRRCCGNDVHHRIYPSAARRRDWRAVHCNGLADGPVYSEPVSTVKFPVRRENTGNLAISPRFPPDRAIQNARDPAVVQGEFPNRWSREFPNVNREDRQSIRETLLTIREDAVRRCSPSKNRLKPRTQQPAISLSTRRGRLAKLRS
jgi:hypothetical protein